MFTRFHVTFYNEGRNSEKRMLLLAYRGRKRPKHSSSFGFRLLQDAFSGIITSGNAPNPFPPLQVYVCMRVWGAGWGGGGERWEGVVETPFLL
jgi:hypothetical protein